MHLLSVCPLPLVTLIRNLLGELLWGKLLSRLGRRCRLVALFRNPKYRSVDCRRRSRAWCM